MHGWSEQNDEGIISYGASTEAVDIATRIICGDVRVTCQDTANGINFTLTEQYNNKKHLSMPKSMVRATVTAVRPCIALHNLAERTQQSRERLGIQSCYLQPREG